MLASWRWFASWWMDIRCHIQHNTENPTDRQYPRKSIGFGTLETGGDNRLPPREENTPQTLWRKNLPPSRQTPTNSLDGFNNFTLHPCPKKLSNQCF